MWGDGLLISPALTANAMTVEAYLPATERWYDLHKVSYCNSPWRPFTRLMM